MTELSPENPVNPVDEVLHHIATALEEWKEKNTPEVITRRVNELLNNSADEVLRKLMGFNKDYKGRWEIDHCNGRNGNSPIGEFLKTSHEVAIRDWLSQVKLPKMTPAFLKRVEQDLQQRYESYIMNQIREMVIERAEKDLEVLLDQVTTSNQIGNYIKMLNLLNNNTTQPAQNK